MKALLDEQLSPQIAEPLRKSGYDVEAVLGRNDLIGRSDRIVFEVACGEGSTVVTNNIKDFRPLAAEFLAQGRSHAGLILLPSARTRSRDTVAAIARAVESIRSDHPQSLRSSERWIGPLQGR